MPHRKPIRKHQCLRLTRLCRHCGAEFHPHRGKRRRTNWYCSITCFNISRRRPALERFLNFVIPGHRPDDCWDWTGQISKANGYAMFRVDGILHRASHSAWLLMYGPIQDDLFVLHSCDNGRCTNPKHLFLGTQSDNMRDALQKNRRAHGEQHHWSKLTAQQVHAIRQSEQLPSDLGRHYGISPSQIRRIQARQRWSYLP